VDGVGAEEVRGVVVALTAGSAFLLVGFPGVLNSGVVRFSGTDFGPRPRLVSRRLQQAERQACGEDYHYPAHLVGPNAVPTPRRSPVRCPDCTDDPVGLKYLGYSQVGGRVRSRAC